MVKIYVTKRLEKDINKRLSPYGADQLFLQMYSLRDNPHKGDVLTNIGNLLIKELKYKKFRVYFIQSKNTIRVVSADDLRDDIIKFVALSQKGKEQQKTIDRVKNDLLDKGFDWF